MSEILIETRLNSLRLNESHTVRKGCLGRLEGICADYANPTRNGRLYGRTLWEKVFNNDLIKESLESKTLIGELDHPEERFEPLAKEACVVMTDYKFNDDEQVVYGGFDILDTPSGRILKSLVDYGCIMGVSSRGQGDLITKDGYEEVDPETYDFACFDVVTTPAVVTARQHVTENVKKQDKQKLKRLNKSIIEQINESTTNSELDIILRVVESANLSNLAEIKSAIRNKRKSIVEGKTISNKTKTDLQNAKTENKNLKKELESLQIKTINEQKKLRSSASNLASQVLAYKHRESRLMETVESQRDKINNLQQQINAKRDTISEMRTKNSDLESQLESLHESIKETMFKYDAALNNESHLRESLNEATQNSNNLTESIVDKDAQLKAKDATIKELKEKLAASEKLVLESKEKAKQDSETKNKALVESKRKITENSKLLESFKNHYIESICKQYGIDSAVIKSTINENTTADSIEDMAKRYVEHLDRYSSLPFTNAAPKPTSVLKENLKEFNDSIQSDLDEELKQAKMFMESVAGIK